MYVIYYRHVGHSGLIHEQIGRFRLMARPNIVALFCHSEILLSVLIRLNALFPTSNDLPYQSYCYGYEAAVQVWLCRDTSARTSVQVQTNHRGSA